MPQNGAHEFPAGQLHHGPAIDHSGGHTCHAAHIFAADEVRLDAAPANGTSRTAGNAAHIVACRTGYMAKIIGVQKDTHIHTAANAAHIATFSFHHTPVEAILNDGLCLVSTQSKLGKLACQIILRVQLIVDAHGTGNAAGIDIAGDLALIDASANLAGLYRIDVRIGGVFDQTTGSSVHHLVHQEHGGGKHLIKCLVNGIELLLGLL